MPLLEIYVTGNNANYTYQFLKEIIPRIITINLTFICPCIVSIITNYYHKNATFLSVFISTDVLHVSGGSSTQHQENTTVHTDSGIVNQHC